MRANMSKAKLPLGDYSSYVKLTWGQYPCGFGGWIPGEGKTQEVPLAWQSEVLRDQEHGRWGGGVW